MGKYRELIREKSYCSDITPYDDWVHISEVENLLDTIESEFNNKMKAIVQSAKEFARNIDSELEEISDDLY